MTDLKPMTALGASSAKTTRIGAVTLTENTDLALASLAMLRGSQQPVLNGIDLPGPGLWAGDQGLGIFWIGPDQWMIEGPGRGNDDFAADLTGMAPGCAVTEQTDGWVVFEVSSFDGATGIDRLMETLVNIDPNEFTTGSATRTSLNHMSVFLIRRSDSHLAILGMRSAAGSLWHALTTTAEQLIRPADPQ